MCPRMADFVAKVFLAFRSETLIQDQLRTRNNESNEPALRFNCYKFLFHRACLATFATWGNSGIVPYEGTRNQLSRNAWGHPDVALQRWRATMEHYVGLDAALKQTSICVVSQVG